MCYALGYRAVKGQSSMGDRIAKNYIFPVGPPNLTNGGKPNCIYLILYSSYSSNILYSIHNTYNIYYYYNQHETHTHMQPHTILY